MLQNCITMQAAKTNYAQLRTQYCTASYLGRIQAASMHQAMQT